VRGEFEISVKAAAHTLESHPAASSVLTATVGFFVGPSGSTSDKAGKPEQLAKSLRGIYTTIYKIYVDENSTRDNRS